MSQYPTIRTLDWHNADRKLKPSTTTPSRRSGAWATSSSTIHLSTTAAPNDTLELGIEHGGNTASTDTSITITTSEARSLGLTLIWAAHLCRLPDRGTTAPVARQLELTTDDHPDNQPATLRLTADTRNGPTVGIVAPETVTLITGDAIRGLRDWLSEVIDDHHEQRN